MSAEKIKPGDQVALRSPYATRRGPFPVRRVAPNGLVWIQKRTAKNKPHLLVRHPRELVRLEPGQTVKQALTAVVPENQRCEICGWRPAPERHFVTVPIPGAFTRVCPEDMADIKKEIRERVKDIVAQVFEEFRTLAELREKEKAER